MGVEGISGIRYDLDWRMCIPVNECSLDYPEQTITTDQFSGGEGITYIIDTTPEAQNRDQLNRRQIVRSTSPLDYADTWWQKGILATLMVVNGVSYISPFRWVVPINPSDDGSELELGGRGAMGCGGPSATPSDGGLDGSDGGAEIPPVITPDTVAVYRGGVFDRRNGEVQTWLATYPSNMRGQVDITITNRPDVLHLALRGTRGAIYFVGGPDEPNMSREGIEATIDMSDAPPHGAIWANVTDPRVNGTQMTLNFQDVDPDITSYQIRVGLNPDTMVDLTTAVSREGDFGFGTLSVKVEKSAVEAVLGTLSGPFYIQVVGGGVSSAAPPVAFYNGPSDLSFLNEDPDTGVPRPATGPSDPPQGPVEVLLGPEMATLKWGPSPTGGLYRVRVTALDGATEDFYTPGTNLMVQGLRRDEVYNIKIETFPRYIYTGAEGGSEPVSVPMQIGYCENMVNPLTCSGLQFVIREPDGSYTVHEILSYDRPGDEEPYYLGFRFPNVDGIEFHPSGPVIPDLSARRNDINEIPYTPRNDETVRIQSEENCRTLGTAAEPCIISLNPHLDQEFLGGTVRMRVGREGAPTPATNPLAPDINGNYAAVISVEATNE